MNLSNLEGSKMPSVLFNCNFVEYIYSDIKTHNNPLQYSIQYRENRQQYYKITKGTIRLIDDKNDIIMN